MNAFSTPSHLAVALYEAGMSESEALGFAKAIWDPSETKSRKNLQQHAFNVDDQAKKLIAKKFVFDQVLAGVTPAKFPAVSTESGFAQAHQAPEVKG